MKTIGLLGGMSWESTITYYQTINSVIGQHLGGLHSAKIVLYSVEFGPLEELQHHGRWAECAGILADAARVVERAGAEFLVMCTNTMHKVAHEIEAAIEIPLLHIADATANRIDAAGLSRIGLLGTRFTMEEEFYRGRLEGEHGLEVIVPDAGDREVVHEIFYHELCRGIIHDDSRREYRRIVAGLTAAGAEGVILGCSEIGLLLRARDVAVPLFDTAQIHADQAALHAIGEDF